MGKKISIPFLLLPRVGRMAKIQKSGFGGQGGRGCPRDPPRDPGTQYGPLGATPVLYRPILKSGFSWRGLHLNSRKAHTYVRVSCGAAIRTGCIPSSRTPLLLASRGRTIVASTAPPLPLDLKRKISAKARPQGRRKGSARSRPRGRETCITVCTAAGRISEPPPQKTAPRPQLLPRVPPLDARGRPWRRCSAKADRRYARERPNGVRPLGSVADSSLRMHVVDGSRPKVGA